MDYLPPEDFRPLTVECVQAAAAYQRVPLAVLVGVLAAEAGQVGEKVKNENGTYDHGPFQINSIWLPELSRHGIGVDLLLNDGCVNAHVSAWILRGLLEKYPLWEAIGSYNSRTPHLHRKYQRSVWEHLMKDIDLASLVARANRKIRSVLASLGKKHDAAAE